jgi:predicted PurR-regulated permease PerM
MENKNENGVMIDSRTIDMSVRILLIVVLFAWCGMIIFPFVMPLLWGIILAITLHPLYKRLNNFLKGKMSLASIITTGIMLLILIIPAVWLIASVVESASQFIASLRENTLVIPPPKASVADWPVVGKPIYNAWLSVTTNVGAAIEQYSDQLIKVGEKFLGAFKSVASSFLMLIISIIISGILLAGSEKTGRSISGFASRLGGEKGEEFIDLIVLTIRNVAKGILGVAFIQFLLLGTVFIIAKIPFAGLWALFVLLFSIIQLPAFIVTVPVIIYLYTAREPLPATLWSVLIILAGLSDNFLKPWLMGMGAPVPMLVIFLGAIGGMIMSGFIGLFTGAIILSLGYKLVTIWLGEGKQQNSEINQTPEK